MSNLKLANAANAALRNPNYTDEPGFCQMFAREVMQATYGSKYDEYFAASARVTGQNFLAAGLGHQFNGDFSSVEVGDVLYKLTGSGNFGHVGIYVGDTKNGPRLVAENSSTPYGRISGAKGYRVLGSNYPREWGEPQVVVRLSVEARLILGFEGDTSSDLHYEAVPGAVLKDGVFYVNSNTVANLLQADDSKLHGGVAPIRDVLSAIGYQVTSTVSKLDDVNDPRLYVFVKD